MFQRPKQKTPCSEEAATEVESTTPQVSRDSVIFVAQVLASMGCTPGFLDFTQAFHSGDAIERQLYCFQPLEGFQVPIRNSCSSFSRPAMV